MLAVGIATAAIVLGLIAWCLVRYRRAPNDDAFPAQVRRNDRFELAYTIVPLLVVTALFALVYPAERHVEAIAAKPEVVVDVTGFRWSWRFVYPHLGIALAGTPSAPPEFVLPLGETTHFNVTSVDVDHSFWVPAFLFKRDAIPGVRNEFDWTPTRLGTFRGECGEFCGLQHADMSFSVRVVEPEAFARWAASRRAAT